MRGWRFFLAYYTLITSLTLFIWSIFFAQKPQSFFLTLLVIPTSFYFWLLVTGVLKSHSPDSPSENQTHNQYVKYPLLVLTTLFISSFSIFIYSLINSRLIASESASLLTASQQLNSLKQELENQNKALRQELVREIQEIKNQLINIKSTQESTGDKNVLKATTTLQVGTITIKDQKNPTVNAYKDKNLSSEVIGIAEFGKTYTFIEKDQNWYLVLLGEKEGYINGEFVKEVRY